MMDARGFVGGSLGGLVLALVLVGAVTFYQHPATTELSQSVQTPSSSSSQHSQSGPSSAAGIYSSSSTPPNQKSTPSPAPQTAPPPPNPRSNSLLAAIPREGAGQLAVTLSPVLVALLLAAAVYGLYVRRQDSRS